MQIELNDEDIVLIESALTIWEQEPSSSNLLSSVLEAILAPKEEREAVRRTAESAQQRAVNETAQRRRRSVLLRAKLYRATTAQALESSWPLHGGLMKPEERTDAH